MKAIKFNNINYCLNSKYLKKSSFLIKLSKNFYGSNSKINTNQKDYFKEYIELRSDVKTLPTKRMLDHMQECHYGDDASWEDPTMNKLLNNLCDLFKKEAALFTPTGRMGNMVGLLTNSSKNDYVILGKKSHLNILEIDSLKILGINVIPTIYLDPINPEAAKYDPDHSTNFNDFSIEDIIIDKRKDFFFTKAYVEKNFQNFESELKKIQSPKILAMENTHNYNGGVLLDMDFFDKKILPIKSNFKTDDEKLIFHLDGSRVLNASVALKKPVEYLTKDFETVNFCLSKGIGAPCGSVVFIENKQFEKALNIRKALGGNMRQAGILAAPTLIAMEDFEQRFEIDHSNAKLLYDGINNIKGLFSPKPQTNIVNVYLDPMYFSKSLIEDFIEILENKHKVLTLAMDNKKYIRCVLHHQVTSVQVKIAIKGFENVANLLINPKKT